MKADSGLNVHNNIIFACILQKGTPLFIKDCTTLTYGIEKLRNHLTIWEVNMVAMESTSIYWIPVWKILVIHFRMILVNAYYITLYFS